MNDVNAYLSKIKKNLFLTMLGLFCLSVIVVLVNEFHDLGFMNLPKEIKQFDDVQNEKISWQQLAFLLLFWISALVLLYLEKILGFYLIFFAEIADNSINFVTGQVGISTPSLSLAYDVCNYLTYSIVAVVGIKLLLNHNFELSNVKRKIGSSGLIFEEVYRQAERGNAEAQISIGTSYFKGLGVLQDFSQAHMWFNLAAGSGSNVAAKKRDLVAKKMSAQQVAEAQELAKGFLAKQI